MIATEYDSPARRRFEHGAVPFLVWIAACSSSVQPDGGPAADSGDAAIHAGATIACAGSSTCVLRADGSVWCWGSNLAGMLGTDGGQDSPVPQHVDVPPAVRLFGGYAGY